MPNSRNRGRSYSCISDPTKTYRQGEDPSKPDSALEWNQVRQTVGELVPTLKDQSRWSDITYEAVEDEKRLDDDTIREGGTSLNTTKPRHRGGQNTAM